MGCRVVVITNQSCVGKKLLSQSELEEIHDAMRQMLCKADECAVLDQIYVCTSVDDNDRRKKPNPGMIFEACRDHGVDASESVFVGDNLTDMQAAQAAGVTKRILVETGYGRGLMGDQSASIPPKVIEKSLIEKSLPEMSTVAPFVFAPNLAAAATWLVREQDKNEL